MNILVICLTLYMGASILYLSFLLWFDKRIEELEREIYVLFQKRSNLIPSLYAVAQEYVVKCDEVFREIIALRKMESAYAIQRSFLEVVEHEKKIHHQLNFIFRILHLYPLLQKDPKFLLIQDLFIENSTIIGEKVDLYKRMVHTFQKYVRLKNITGIGIFFLIDQRYEL